MLPVDRTTDTTGLDQNNSTGELILRPVFSGLKMMGINSNLCLIEDSYRFVCEQLFIFETSQVLRWKIL